MDSILNSVKKMLGLPEEDNCFDIDIITHINTAFVVLNQMGVGPSVPFFIEDEFASWSSFDSGDVHIGMVKTYVYQKVRMMFDPPSNGAHKEALQQSISELEWRLSVSHTFATEIM